MSCLIPKNIPQSVPFFNNKFPQHPQLMSNHPRFIHLWTADEDLAPAGDKCPANPSGQIAG